MTITRYGRYFAVYDDEQVLVCPCVYRKGAREVVRRMTGGTDEPASGHRTRTRRKETPA